MVLRHVVTVEPCSPGWRGRRRKGGPRHRDEGDKVCVRTTGLTFFREEACVEDALNHDGRSDERDGFSGVAVDARRGERLCVMVRGEAWEQEVPRLSG